MHSFTCFDRCRELGGQGMPLPRPMTCPAAKPQRRELQGAGAANGTLPIASSSSSTGAGGGVGAGNASAPVAATGALTTAGGAANGPASQGGTAVGDAGSQPDHSADLWEALVSTARAHDPKLPRGQLLSKRTEDDDWLREGGTMPPGLTASLRRALHNYIADLGRPDVPGGAVPPASQRGGRGIVMVSGGLRFMVSAWIGVAMLRRSGSRLPVEMWFPVLEYPTAPVVEALRAQGVTCRTFAVADLDQAGYSLKIAAIMLSSFSEVLFLDADNFPLHDPATLFDSAEYGRAGCVFWRDYWDPTAVPELAEVLDVPRRDLPASTFETGQMLIDKRRHWRGLRVALYLNYYSEVWYNLFTDYMGWGDKETFYYAFLAAREPTYYVPTPTGSVGMRRSFCRRFKTRQLCREVFTGNSMVQYALSGRPLFLHANLEKWSLRLPDSFDAYVRRWQVLQPGGEAFREWSERELGLDLERFAFDQARSFRCAPFFEEYYEVRLRHGDRPIPPLAGLHTLMPGIEFHQMYRLGHRGTYTDFFERSALDNFFFSLGVASRTALPPVKRALRRVWGGRKLVRLLFKLERRLRNALLASSM